MDQQNLFPWSRDRDGQKPASTSHLTHCPSCLSQYLGYCGKIIFTAWLPVSGIILIMSFVLFWTLTSCCSGYSYDNFSKLTDLSATTVCVVLGLECVWMYNGWGADLTLGSCPAFQGVKGQSGPRGCHSHTGDLFLCWFLSHCFFGLDAASMLIYVYGCSIGKMSNFPTLSLQFFFLFYQRNNFNAHNSCRFFLCNEFDVNKFQSYNSIDVTRTKMSTIHLP